MEQSEWNAKGDYLSATRGLYYNDDYLEFLIRQVWKADGPVNVIDFGCGYGYLGTKLLPLLPSGSSYTGVDTADKLLDRGRELFREAPYRTTFLHADVQERSFPQKYDWAVCHALLLHVPNPENVLQKMLDSLVDGGRILCFEPHWISTMAGYSLDGTPLSEVVKLGILQKLFEQGAQRGGKDGNIGGKLPLYLSRLGVQRIECRVSDKVNLLTPEGEPQQQAALYNALKTEGFGADPGPEEAFVEGLVRRGLSPEEARAQYEAERHLAGLFTRESALTWAPGMKITTGVVERRGGEGAG
ncbi:class I SAM-dependent methyltransferase [Paenibacillus aurantius]|uniref:Class I SAM-dependent methyltransferase n=1 Tax=Paenibacillus aurantius TaxID=2918900 RepID=A0AA96LCC9_9BACL|nr:class I SAM-dependent methyltransferase [Paenibacillus aurantius]WNQ11061.1 class I SAM-dependent methyltransferase [Paenibacillus aurantius]